jgi:hypothetical protein
MIASPERAALEVLAPWVYSYVTSDGNTQRANTEAFSHYGNARTRNEPVIRVPPVCAQRR